MKDIVQIMFGAIWFVLIFGAGAGFLGFLTRPIVGAWTLGYTWFGLWPL